MMTDEQKARILQLHAMEWALPPSAELGKSAIQSNRFISRNKNALPTTRCDFAEEKSFKFKQKPKRFCSDQCRMRVVERPPRRN